MLVPKRQGYGVAQTASHVMLQETSCEARGDRIVPVDMKNLPGASPWTRELEEPQSIRKHKSVLVLDASALLAGFDPLDTDEEQYTVQAVEGEVSRNRTTYIRFRTAVETGSLRVVEPSKRYILKAKTAASSAGDITALSGVDLQILALALQLKSQGFRPLIATDDYSIQNVAHRMNIEFSSLATFGIRSYLAWTIYCPACKRKYSSDHGEERCGVCGTKLKRKVRHQE